MRLASCFCAVLASLVVHCVGYSQTQLVPQGQFSSNGGIGLAFDPVTDSVWTHGSDTIFSYSRTGTPLATFNNAPGEFANDADLDFADVTMTLGATEVPPARLSLWSKIEFHRVLLWSIINYVNQGIMGADRVLLLWDDNVIRNRWLSIQLQIGGFTQVLVVGHLLGETTGQVGGVYTSSFEDISIIRTGVGGNVSAGNSLDVDKNGIVSFSDISAMRQGIGTQLSNITLP